MTYKPSAGDRVKVTVEGVVKEAGRDWFDLGVNTFDTDAADSPRASGTTYSFEKLADPEPRWVNGDVVRISVGTAPPLFHAGGRWHWANGDGESAVVTPEHMTHKWSTGNVEILYKHTV